MLALLLPPRAERLLLSAADDDDGPELELFGPTDRLLLSLVEGSRRAEEILLPADSLLPQLEAPGLARATSYPLLPLCFEEGAGGALEST